MSPRGVAVGLLLVVATACSRGPGQITLTLVPPTADAPAVVRASGLSSEEIQRLRSASLDEEGWTAILRVAVAGTDTLPVAGTYVIAGNAVEFRPRFPFDAGREYTVRFNPSELPVPRAEPAVLATLSLPARAAERETVVTSITPSGDRWPENILRFYVHFSAPMSRVVALEHLRLEDDAGVEVGESFLPVEADLWNPDRTRLTVFFDPGRVKRGIRPNVELGRALHAGRRYAIVVDRNWPDGAGRPLAGTFRHEFIAGPAEERAVEPSDWALAPPAAGTRDPLTITFPWPLDHGLLPRSIGVERLDGTSVPGESEAGDAERRLRFVPTEPWRAGPHRLVVLTLLEDPAGNRVGRPFEVEMLRAPRPDPGERVFLPFAIVGPSGR